MGKNSTKIKDEKDMSIEDQDTTSKQSGNISGKTAIVKAVARYFEKTPASRPSASNTVESSIITALDRYFEEKK